MSEKIISRVAKLLAQAEHPNTSDTEREKYLAKADKLMSKHQIDEALVRAAQTPGERRKPVVVDVSDMFDRNSVYGQKMQLIAGQVCRTVGVRMAVRYSTADRGNIVTLVGFDEDVRWAQMLFMNIQMTFMGRMSPKWDDSRTPGLNLAMLRESGLSWNDIAYRAARAGFVENTWSHLPDYEWYDWNTGKTTNPQRDERWRVEYKLERIYKRHCREIGVTPARVTRHEAYRHTYVEAFISRICSRLEEMADSRKEAGTGMEVVLATVKKDVDDMFYVVFPNLHPDARRAEMERRQKQIEEDAEKHAAWLASLTPAARLRYEKEQTAEREKEARDNDRYWREEERRSEKLYDTNGGQAGRAAADSVNLLRADSINDDPRKALDQ